MKELLQYLIEQLVDNPKDVSVEEVDRGGKNLLVVHVATEDIGKIIGKHGRIIHAIRDLMKLVATKKNVYVDVEIAE
jgi:uncharacterized protein